MKVILTKINQAVKQLISKLNNRRCSSANGFFTFEIVGAVTSLILLRKHTSRRSVVTITSLLSIFTLGLIGIGGIGVSNVSASSLSLSVSDPTISLDVLASPNGTYTKSTSSTITATTDNLTGYTLSIMSSNGSGTTSSDYDKLINSADSNAKLSSISSATTEESFAALASKDTYNGKWGYLPSKYNSTTNTSFLPAPDNITGDIINVTNLANTAGERDEYSLAIGARIDSSIKVGSYTNTFVLTAVANGVPYSITYNDSVVSDMPVDESGSAPDSTVYVSTTTPTRSGFTFTGWCSTLPTSSNNSQALDTCSGTTFSAGSPYSLTSPTANDLSLYAMWSDDGGGSGSYVPVTVNITGAGASAVTGVTFTDSTDHVSITVDTSGGVAGLKAGTTYTMTGNGPASPSWSTTSGTIGSATTNPTTYTVTTASTLTATVDCISTLSGYMQDASVASAYCDGASGSLTDRRDNQIYTVKKINGALWMTRNLAIGCNGSGSTYGSSVSSKSLTSTYSNVSSTWSTPTALLSTAANSSSTSGYTTAAMQCNSTYGAWYNYVAATAGTITGSSNDTNATKDICPAGWHLPAYGSSASEAGSIRSIVSYSSAFSPVAGGYYNTGSLLNTGYGAWWSATASNTTDRYSLTWYDSSLDTYGDSYRYLGHYVRCVRS